MARPRRQRHNGRVSRVVIIGGGPGGYEAALVAAQLGAEVTVVDTDGVGGSAVLTDCVPSKTLIATAELMADTELLEAVCNERYHGQEHWVGKIWTLRNPR